MTSTEGLTATCAAAIKVQYLLQPFPKLVMEPNHMCLLLLLLLSPLIIWLSELLILLGKIHFPLLAVYQDPAQLYIL